MKKELLNKIEEKRNEMNEINYKICLIKGDGDAGKVNTILVQQLNPRDLDLIDLFIDDIRLFNEDEGELDFDLSVDEVLEQTSVENLEKFIEFLEKMIDEKNQILENLL